VIWRVFFTLRIRRRMSRMFGIRYQPNYKALYFGTA